MLKHSLDYPYMCAQPILSRLWAPISKQLKQGATPEKVALSFAIGAVLGMSPLVGTTTVLCVFIGTLFRLNQIALQAANYLIFPAQIPMILLFIKFGEWIYGAKQSSLSSLQLKDEILLHPIQFFKIFGMTGLHALTAWILLAPCIIGIIHFSLLPFLKRSRRV